MGLMQKALETYDAMSAWAGVTVENRETLAPVGHITAKAKIEITLDADGGFVQARAVDEKIVIPATEKSAGRSGTKPAAHPLCEQIGYLLPGNEEKFRLYTQQLEQWANSRYGSPKLNAILNYVRRGTLQTDLARAGLLQMDEKGAVKNEKDMVRWIVNGVGEESGPVWTDLRLLRGFGKFYLESRGRTADRLCMLTGEETLGAAQHLKGVVPMHGNAKIISGNDTSNFTYLGRFADAGEAATVGYIASQKAHNALKWLVCNDGYSFGSRTFVCWNPQGLEVPKAQNPLGKNRKSEGKEEPLKPTAYREELEKTVRGWKNSLPQNAGVVLAAFDAATAGRLAVLYYNELQASDFIDRLAYWDETCCWYDSRWGTMSPLLDRIVQFAFGVQRGSDESARVEVDDKVRAQQLQRLLTCRTEKAAMPEDVMRALVRKCDNLQVYNAHNRDTLLFTACAVIRKYRMDRKKEDLPMALEPEKRDRSYQFGRLLAVLEKAERDTYDKDEKRETNAIRLQPMFVRRPGTTAKTVLEQVKNAYYPRLSVKSRNFYEILIGQIMEQISERTEEKYDSPLTETYLLGYYLQKNALYTKKQDDTEVENDDAQE